MINKDLQEIAKLKAAYENAVSSNTIAGSSGMFDMGEAAPKPSWVRNETEAVKTVAHGIEIVRKLSSPRVRLYNPNVSLGQMNNNWIELGWSDTGVFEVTTHDGNLSDMNEAARTFIGAIIAQMNGLVR